MEQQETRTFIEWVKNPAPIIMPDSIKAHKELLIIANRKDMSIGCVQLPFPNFEEWQKRKIQGKKVINLLLRQN